MFRNLLPAMRRRMEPASLPARMSEAVEDFWRSSFDLPWAIGEMKVQYPQVDLREDEKEITVTAELPGMDAKDVEIGIENNRLILKGEKRFEGEEKKDSYHRVERSYGSFYRALSLPCRVEEEAVTAAFGKGVLTVRLPKAEGAAGRKIHIQST